MAIETIATSDLENTSPRLEGKVKTASSCGATTA